MKKALAVASGFVVGLGMFGGGALVTFMVLKTAPDRALAASTDVADVWSSAPRVVDASAQDFERLPGVAPAGEQVASARAMPDEEPVDVMTTASLGPREQAGEPRVVDPLEAELIVAHVEWCFGRYRSYDPDTNTYRPYRGGRQDCVSPYLEELEAIASSGGADWADEAASEEGGVEFASIEERPARVEEAGGALLLRVDGRAPAGQASGLTAAHVEACFSRSRSYDPATNTYQPFGGGPRRQCE